MLGLLPIFFALTILDTAHPASSAHMHTWTWWALVFTASVTSWSLLCELVSVLLSRQPNRRWLERWDNLAQALSLVWFGWICFALGWTGRVGLNTTASMLPWVLMQLVHWWGLAGGDHCDGESRLGGRLRFVLHQLRFGMLPLLLLLPVFDTCNWLTQRSGLQPWLIGRIGLPVTMFLGSVALWGAGLILLPGILSWLWRTQPMPAGPLADELWSACRRMGVRVSAMRYWPADGGRSYNAMLNGVIPVMRYVFFTEDLVRDLPRAQLMAVLGHELGHARHRHLLLYYLFALGTVLLALLVAEPLAGQLGHLRWSRDWSADLRKCAVTLVLIAVEWRLIFGYLSRACERQADLTGAELCGDARIMRDTLRTVALHTGVPEDAPSWAHSSIAERAAFLDGVAADPGLAAHHHRLVRRWWYGVTPLVLALAGILGIMALHLVHAR